MIDPGPARRDAGAEAAERNLVTGLGRAADLITSLRVIVGTLIAAVVVVVAFVTTGTLPGLGGDEPAQGGVPKIALERGPLQQNVSLGDHLRQLERPPPGADGLSPAVLATNGDVYSVHITFRGFRERRCQTEWRLFDQANNRLELDPALPRRQECAGGGEVPAFTQEVWVPVPDGVYAYRLRIYLLDDRETTLASAPGALIHTAG